MKKISCGILATGYKIEEIYIAEINRNKIKKPCCREDFSSR